MNTPLGERAKPLIKQIFILTTQLPQIYQYSIGEQLRRSSLSIGLNIAESGGRKNYKERIQFLNIAFGSLKETVYIIQLIRDLEIPGKFDVDGILHNLDELARILYVIIHKNIKQSLSRAHKFLLFICYCY